MKTDICDKIDEKIADVASITTLKTQAESQAETLNGPKQSASRTTHSVADLEAQVKHPTGR